MIVLPGDDRLWDIQADYQIPLVHAAFFLAAMVAVFVFLKLAVWRGRL